MKSSMLCGIVLVMRKSQMKKLHGKQDMLICMNLYKQVRWILDDIICLHLFTFCFNLPAQMSRNEHIALQFYCYLERIAMQCAHLSRQSETKCKQMISSRIHPLCLYSQVPNKRGGGSK